MSKFYDFFGGSRKTIPSWSGRLQSTGKQVKSIIRSNRGNVGMMFAMLSVPLVALAGAGIDYAHVNKVRAEMQAACDAGALAGMRAKSKPGTDYLKIAKDYFENNLGPQLSDKRPDIQIAETDKGIEITATKDVPTTTLSLVNIDSIPVTVNCQSEYAKLLPMEVVFVLDYSGSMNARTRDRSSRKWQAARDATQQLIHQLTANESFTDVDIALVPFSHYVRGTLPGQFVRPQGRNCRCRRGWRGRRCRQACRARQASSNPPEVTACFNDRGYPYNLTDSTPTDDTASKWPVVNNSHCRLMQRRNLNILPLTNDYELVRNTLASYRPASLTHIQLGLAFGRHVLSDNEPFVEGGPDNDPDKPKVLILLTDGRQTAPGNGPRRASVWQAENNIEEICTNIKDKGVIIFTVAYDVRDAETRRRLRQCSSEPNTPDNHPYYYEPYRGEDLFGAFAGIGHQLNPDSLRLSN